MTHIILIQLKEYIAITDVYIRVLDLMNNMIGCEIDLPNYLLNSKSCYAFKDVKYNMCFWHCVAAFYGCRRDRTTFYGK